MIRMQIHRLLVRNFRNYEEQIIEWHPGLNLITGLNGQGKSNLIEACCYFSLASSYRDSNDTDLIRWGAPFFYLAADITGQNMFTGEHSSFSMSVGFTREKRKLWKIEGKPQKKTSQVLGHFQTVIFSPEDLSLVKAGPALRRKFLNRELLQLDKEFYPVYSGYRQTVEQRNKYLKQSYGNVDLTMIEVWDQQLAEFGARMIMKRKQLLDEITPFAIKIHNLLSGGKERLSLVYETPLCLGKEEKEMFWQKAEEKTGEDQFLFFKERFAFALEKNRKEDFYKGTTCVGPHRDDISIFVNEMSARQFASQGQQRTAALALKLAEIDLFYKKTGSYPVLLLDDVMSELDGYRAGQLLEWVGAKCQTFITNTEASFMDKISQNGKIFYIEQGKLK